MGGALGAIINKKAMAETPSEVTNWYLFFCAWIICTSGGLHGYNAANISGILKMDNFIASFHLKEYTSIEYANISGWVTSVIVLGGVVGSLVAAPLNDWFGRKKSLFLSGVLYLVGCVIQISTSSNIDQVIGARGVQGFAGGIASVTGTMYVAELSPKAIRGLMGAFFSTNTLLGIALGYWANYGALLNISDSSPWQWRTPLLVQMIPGIILVTCIPFIIESPRYLIFKGNVAKAHRQLSKIRRLPEDHDFVLQELTDITAAIDADKDKSVSWVGLGNELWSDRTLLRRFVLVMIVQIGFNFSGGNSITYYETTILDTIGISGDGAYLFSSIYGMVKLFSSLVYAFLCAERFGRRKMLLFGAVVDIVCVTWVAIYLSVLNGNAAGGWVSVAALCVFAFGYGTGWSPVAFGLNGELFPNHLRAKIMSICLAVQYAFNFILVRLFTNIAAAGGPSAPFIIFACVSTAITIYLVFALPETKGVGLEHMDGLFGHHWFLNGLRSNDSHAKLNAQAHADFDSFKDPTKAGPAEISHIEKSEQALRPLSSP